MEAIISIYQLSNTLITVYGYWKMANVSYENYQRAKFLFDILVGVLNKLQHLLDNTENHEKLVLDMEKINKIKNEVEKNLPRFYYSKKPFKKPWEILHKKEILKEIEDSYRETKFYTLPNLINFYSYTDEHGNTISEL